MVTNGPDLFDRTYLKFLTKTVRDHFDFGEVPIRFILKTKGEASAYSDRKAFLQAEAEALQEKDGTDEIPALADTPPADRLRPVRVNEDEPDDEQEEFDADAEVPDENGSAEPPRQPDPPKPPPVFRPEPPKKRKKKPGTWEV
jgi:GTPase